MLGLSACTERLRCCGCGQDRQPKDPPPPIHRLIEKIKVQLGRLAWKVSFEVQHPVLFVEPWWFGQLRRDYIDCGQLNAFRCQFGEDLSEPCGSWPPEIPVRPDADNGRNEKAVKRASAEADSP